MGKQESEIKDGRAVKERHNSDLGEGNKEKRISEFRKYMQDKMNENLPEEQMINAGSTAQRVGAKEIQNGQRIRLNDQISLIKTHEIGIIDNVSIRSDMSRYIMEKIIGGKDDGTPLIREYRVYGNVPVIKLTDPKFTDYKYAYIEYILNESRITKNSGYLGELEEVVTGEQAEDMQDKDRYCICVDAVQLDATKKIEIGERERARNRRAEQKSLDEVATNVNTKPTKIVYRAIENGQRIAISPEVSLTRVSEIGYAYNIQETSHMFEYCMERVVGTDESGDAKVEKSFVYGNVPVNRLDDPKYKEAYLKYILNQGRLEQTGGYLGELAERPKSEINSDADKYYIVIDELEKCVAINSRDKVGNITEVPKREPRQAEVIPIDSIKKRRKNDPER